MVEGEVGILLWNEAEWFGPQSLSTLSISHFCRSDVTSTNKNRNWEVVVMLFSVSVYLPRILLSQTKDIGSYQTNINI